MAANFNAIPETIKNLPQWCVYKLEIVNGNNTKVPYQTSGSRAKSNDPKTWTTFDAALTTYRESLGSFDGICFMLAKEGNLVFIDLDNCISDGIIESWAQEIVESFNSYTEISQSGKGLHILINGVKPGARCRTINSPHKIEIYEHSRQCCCTGDVIDNHNVIQGDRNKVLGALYNKMFQKDPEKTELYINRDPLPSSGNLSDDAIVMKAEYAKNRDKFYQLWHGYTIGYVNKDTGDVDNSAADAALMSMLAFWTRCDSFQMERLFSRSGLGQRSKWKERRDYRDSTIRNAISYCRDVYDPHPKHDTGDVITVDAIDFTPNDNYNCGSSQKLEDQFIITKTKKTVVIVGPNVSKNVDECIRGLSIYNKIEPRVFQRGGMLCGIKTLENNRVCAANFTPHNFRTIMSRAISFETVNEKGERKEVPPNMDLVKGVLANHSYSDFPALLGITNVPVLRKDGTIFNTPGFDTVDSTGFYYHPAKDLKVPKIPDKLTQNDAIEAAKFIVDEILVDFPFVDEASRTNMVAAFLGPVVRPMIDGCIPICLIDKPSQGTGASKLVELVSLVVMGQNMPATATPQGEHQEDEWRKLITSLLKDALPIICLDNIEADIKSSNLASVLTSTIWKSRILMTSDSIELPNRACWYANGNQLVLSGDIPRR